MLCRLQQLIAAHSAAIHLAGQAFVFVMPVTSSFPMPKRYGSFRISSYFLPASRAIMHKFLVYHRPHATGA